MMDKEYVKRLTNIMDTSEQGDMTDEGFESSLRDQFMPIFAEYGRTEEEGKEDLFTISMRAASDGILC